MKCKTLSCCIVVKNGEDKIISCLDNISILADEIVVVDTGSTDKTCAAVNWWATKHNAKNNVKVVAVGDKFHDAEGDFNFGEAKTFAFRQATRDYVMWLDVNDEVLDQVELKNSFVRHAHEGEVYISVPTVTSPRHSFKRVRIGPREKSKMVGRIHEYMVIENPSEDIRRVDLNVAIKNFKENRNLDRNLRQLLKEWELRETSRTAFYIADTYRGLGEPENAIKWYRIRVSRFDWIQEYHDEHCKALECIADLTLRIINGGKCDPDDVYDVASELIRLEPSRMEGYYYMARYYMHRREWETALAYLRKYKECSIPKNAGMWLNEHIYHGRTIVNCIEKCKTALKYQGVLEPEAIVETRPRSTFRGGDDQYEVNKDQTIF